MALLQSFFRCDFFLFPTPIFYKKLFELNCKIITFLNTLPLACFSCPEVVIMTKLSYQNGTK